MNDKYLWDNSGEPDEEIRQLEALLSEFSYQPRPLALPIEPPKRIIFQYAPIRYAALAAMILLAVGLGFWLALRQSKQPEQAGRGNVAVPTPTTFPSAKERQPEQEPEASEQKLVRHNLTPQTQARYVRVAHKRVHKKSLEKQEEEAVEKVLYALQLTSDKLNLITRKIQTDVN